MPKLSIITINYNNSAGLQKTMESVFAQTFTDYEYIIIDGGSTDGSKEIIEQHKDNLTYWVSEKDEGVYDAMNKAIPKTTGAYLMFLNSGDYLLNNNKLKTTISDIVEKADIYYGNIMIEKSEGNFTSKKHAKNLTLDLLEFETINHQASFIKRELFYDLGLYDCFYKMAADHAFFIKCMINGKIFLQIDDDIVYYDLNGMSATNGNAYRKEMIEIAKNLIPEYVNNLRMKNKKYEEILNHKILRFAKFIDSKYQKFRNYKK